jgi:hypothetical protein
LRIGDVRTTQLKKIISGDNDAYMRLIQEQQSGKFRPVCNGCDFYRSVYHHTTNYRRNKTLTQNISEYFIKLRNKTN